MTMGTRAAAITLILLPLANAHGQDDPFGPGWPAGEGREDVGYFCSACHSLELVKQQGLSRARWDHLLTWMAATQNMPPLEGEERTRFLDYLAANFGEDRARPSATEDVGASGPATGARSGQGVALPTLTIRPRQ
jgi:hypothetical protein